MPRLTTEAGGTTRPIVPCSSLGCARCYALESPRLVALLCRKHARLIKLERVRS